MARCASRGSVPRIIDIPSTSFFVSGPRGTGKSTWLREVFPEALRIDLLDPAQHRRLQARPERLMELVRGQPGLRDVIIDEVQKAPDLLPVVHLLIEECADLRFVLTGSSARRLRRGGSNLLAGRAVELGMYPFMAAELGDAFDLGRALREGLIPLVWASADPTQTLAAYVNLYVREEVRSEGLARRSGAFDRFLEVISFSHGRTVNLANVASECSVPRTTVASWLGILEDLLLAFRIPVFSRRAGRQTTTHEKLFLFDTGLFRTLRPTGPLDRSEEIEGAALEGLVAQHLRTWCAWTGARLHHWRTRGGSEVDFVLYGAQTFLAVEVKRAAQVRSADLRGLKAFKDDYPEAQAILLYLGEHPLQIGDIHCLPVSHFLKSLYPQESITLPSRE